jgi:Cu2+-exporting ATPase
MMQMTQTIQMTPSYICPMHPEVESDKPGMCPECGMQLVKYDKHPPSHEASDGHGAGHKSASFLRKFWVSLILTLPVVLYSDLVRETFGLELPTFPGAEYMPLVLGSAVFFYGGWVFLAGAARELRAHLPGMMTLIALAITAAYTYSVGVVLSGPAFAKVATGKETLFWELTTLITIMLFGHWLEMRSVQSAQSALRELSKLLPDTAEVIRDGGNQTIPLSELRDGDIVFVRPGGKVPGDGVVVEGKSEVDESLMTGESRPVPKQAGSEVIAGSINGDGSLQVRVTKIGEHTFLAGVMRLVSEAQASKSRLQLLSDRAAFYLTLIAITVGGATFVLWLAFGSGIAFAVTRLVAVLVIACPHALGLAVPLVASLSTTLAAREGFLVKRRSALEAARNLDIVLFDKTGTLTTGEYGVTEIIPSSKIKDPNEILRFAAAVDAHSEHFISRAIVKEAEKRGIAIPEIKDFERLPGRGVKGIMDGKAVFVGGEAILSEIPNSGFQIPKEVKELAEQGKTIIYVIADNQLLGVIALADVIRKESRAAIKMLKELGVKTAMLTGDSEEVARGVAGELGIDEYYSRVLPEGKVNIVKKLQNPNHKLQTKPKSQIIKRKRFGIWNLEFGISGNRRFVAMVGDGINDAPALAQADLGIAIGAGTNVAIESAGIILVRNDPRDIVKIIRLARFTYSKMLQNLLWASGYNVVAIPLAAGALYSRGIVLEPALAAILMSLSTVIVAVNALLLKKKKL